MGASQSNNQSMSSMHERQAQNTSNVDPLTQRVLPTVNPLAEVPRRVRTGQVQSVKFNMSTDPRGDIDHLVGASTPSHGAHPRALGALQDRRDMAMILENNRVNYIPHK